MNSLNIGGDSHSGGESTAIDNVSRSGRVRKKNSLLAVYESSDVSEKRKRKSGTIHRGRGRGAKSVTSRSQEKSPNFKTKTQNNYQYDSYDSVEPPGDVYLNAGDYGLFQEEFDGEVPDIAAEEIIDESLLDEEDDATELPHSMHSSNINVRLKSQAESTYMMEKSFDKNRKVTGVQITGTKLKTTRKDKGTPRVTAYMLWAKEQRANFSKKYPHLDFSTLSKKLSELWGTVPQNQKKMWKTKAAKIMKKKLNGAENIKNSGGPSLVLARKSLSSGPQRKGMKNTTPEEVYVPKRPPGRPPKKIHFISATEPKLLTKPIPGPSTETQTYNNHTYNQSPFKVPAIPTKSLIARVATTDTALSPQLKAVTIEEKPEPYKYQVTETDPLAVAAHLSLLGESMTKMGAQLLNNAQDQSVNDSLSVLLDSLLCSVGPLLCLTKQVPEFDCIPESQLKRILNNVDFIMPGV